MSPEAKPRRVLVIDERVELRRALAELLAGSGSRVYDVGSPLGATSLIARLRIDLLILGSRLSSSTGRRVAQLVRNGPRLQHLKVVLVVAAPSTSPLERRRDYAEVDAVVPEATLEHDLLPTVTRLLAQLPSERSARPVALVDPEA